MLASMILLLIAVSLLCAARLQDGFADWYAENVYPMFVGTLGRFCSLIPFSVAEILLYAALLMCLVAFFAAAVRAVIRICRRNPENVWYAPLAGWLSGVTLFAAVLIVVYTCTCGINYSRESFSQKAGYDLQPATEEELRETCRMVIDQINAEADAIDYGEDGRSLLTVSAAEETRKAMSALGEQYECLKGYYPRPKGLLVSEILSWQQLSGIYSPFTVEANYNADMPAWEIPVTMCHELSHLRGFMREDEAGFIAYLACIGSDCAELRYSGAMLAFSYCMNAYYDAAGEEAWQELYSALDERAWQDRWNSNRWWRQFDGPVAEASNSVNDAYLKANNQTDGVRSYGRMADLIIAYWRQNK